MFYRPHFDDHIKQLSAQKGVQDELLQRFRQIQKRLCDLKFESDEVCVCFGDEFV